MPDPLDSKLPPSTRIVIGLIGAVQFVNIVDFMIVMPLGPNFTEGLGIPAARLGWIAGSYTVSAALIGLLGSLFLDRYERRVALCVSMLGLSLGTLSCAFATGLTSLIIARAVAGFFGGPATSVSLAMIADAVPVSHRGRAMGAVMGAFAAASVLGVPLSLEAARWGGWRLPFVAVAILGFALTALAFFKLPKTGAPAGQHSLKQALGVTVLSLSRPIVWVSHLATFLMMVAGFLIIPNIASFLVFNRHYPQRLLSMLYLVGGVASFFTSRWAGRWIDARGALSTAVAGTMGLCALIIAGFALDRVWLPIPAVFVGFMISMALRNAAINTLSSKIPRPGERAGYMSFQSAVKHIATSTGSFVAAAMLSEDKTHALKGMPLVAAIAAGAGLTMPWLIALIERSLKRQALEGV